MFKPAARVNEEFDVIIGNSMVAERPLSKSRRRRAQKGVRFCFGTLGSLLLARFLFRSGPYFHQKQKATIFVTFETQGGFTNQLLDIAYVSTLTAMISPCLLLVPELWSDGTQIDGVNSVKSPQVPFEELFDLTVFSSFMGMQGVHVVAHTWKTRQVESSCKFTCRADRPIKDCLHIATARAPQFCPLKYIVVQAPFLHKVWSTTFLRGNSELFLDTLVHLRPSPKIKLEVDTIHKSFVRNSRTQRMCFLHARIEGDWNHHCLQWHPYRPDYKYNCYVSLEEIFGRLSEFQLNDCDLHATYDATQASDSAEEVLQHLSKRAGYIMISHPTIANSSSRGREENAAVQFFLALRSYKFIGNSVSTLSALVMLLRQREDLWSAQYNRGPIPLAGFVPGYRLPWVFTVRGSDKYYDEMMKIAVRSAQLHTTLIPHAVAHPSEANHPRISWLVNSGVRVIFHATNWDGHVAKILTFSSGKDKASSHLYTDVNATMSTYFRLDIGVIPELAHFEHFLYTDTDVIFRKDVNYFTQPVLPDSIQMGYETEDTYPLNAGVYLASMKFLRETHTELIHMLLSSFNVRDKIYGPGDQGILNRMYEGQLKSNGPLIASLNSKPYKPFLSEAAIVHFHGPKIHDYVQFAQSGTCRFRNLCRKGLENGFCRYFSEIRDVVQSYSSVLFDRDDEYTMHRWCKRQNTPLIFWG